MAKSIVSGSHVIDNTERLICTLSLWWPLVDVYVDPKADPNAVGTKWRVYAVSGANKALLAEGVFNQTEALAQGLSQRVLARAQGSGTTIALYAVTDGVPTTAALAAVMVGYDDGSLDSVPEAQTATHAVDTNTVFGTLATGWPRVGALVNAGGAPDALGTKWDVVAKFPSVAGFADAVVASQILTDVHEELIGTPTSPFVEAGAEEFYLRATSPQAVTSPVTAVILGLPSLAIGSGSGGRVAPLLAETYVNAVTGDDGNSGAVGAPIRTLAEVNRRVSAAGEITEKKTVFLQTDFPATDPILLTNLLINTPELFTFVGTRTAIRTGTCTAYTSVDRSYGGDATKFTDGEVPDWTPDLAATGRRIRNTTPGPNLNQLLYVAANIGGGQCWTSASNAPAFWPAPSGDVTPGVFSPGDAYVVEKLSKVYYQGVVGQNVSGDINTLDFQDLDFQAQVDEVAITTAGNVSPAFVACNFANTSLNADCNLIACATMNGLGQFSKTVYYSGGLCGGLTCFDEYPFLTLANDFTCWGGGINLNSGTILSFSGGGVGVFNAPGDAITLGDTEQANASLRLFFGSPAGVYGKGNGGVGWAQVLGTFSIGSGCLAGVTISGAGGDFSLGGVTNASRAFDEGTNGYTAPIPSTWANLATAIGDGGFGGNAHNVGQNAHILAAA